MTYLSALFSTKAERVELTGVDECGTRNEDRHDRHEYNTPRVPVRPRHGAVPLDNVESPVARAEMEQDAHCRHAEAEEQVDDTVLAFLCRVVQRRLGAKGGVRLKLLRQQHVCERKAKVVPD